MSDQLVNRLIEFAEKTPFHDTKAIIREAAAALSAQAVQPVAWLHEIIEPEVYLNQAQKLLSFSADNPWSHWLAEHRDKCVYRCTPLYATLAQQAPEPQGEADWRDDPSIDERWNAGLDFAMLQLCAALGVDADSISFDAATETLDGDVQSVMWRILRAKFGDDFPATRPQPVESPVTEAMERFLRDARVWLDSRAENAKPGWMVAQLPAIEAALSPAPEKP